VAVWARQKAVAVATKILALSLRMLSYLLS
jgi:hypothetical protein